MSHEMRTPLFSVLSFLDLALQTTLDDEQQNFLQSAHSSGKLLSATLDSVLDKSKASAAAAALNADLASKDAWRGKFNAALGDLKSSPETTQRVRVSEVCDTRDYVWHCIPSCVERGVLIAVLDKHACNSHPSNLVHLCSCAAGR